MEGNELMANLSALKAASGTQVPTGTIMPFTGTTIPSGWVEADGSYLNTADYPALDAIITSGSWDQTGATGSQFRLPDLRNRFLRGTGTQGIDGAGGTAVSLGVDQNDDTHRKNISASASSSSISGSANNGGSHTHSFTARVTDTTGSGVISNVGNTSSGDFTVAGSVISTSSSHSHTLSGTAAAQSISIGGGGSETRPKSYGVTYIIKT